MKTNCQTRKLGEVCDLIKGKKPKIFVSRGNKPYLTAKVIRKTEKPKFAAENCPSSVWVKKEDIVIIMDGSNSGEMFTGLEGALASTMGIIKYSKDLLASRYILHFLITHRENFTKSRTGAAIPHLNKEEFENLEIPLPLLHEQIRIVKILDEVFGKMEIAKKNAERNLRNSKELFESYLQEVFANRGDEWEEKRLEEVCEIKPQKKEAKEKLNENDLVSFLPMADLGVSQKDVTAKQERKLEDVSGSYTYFADNDVLLAKITPCFENGKLGIARNLKNKVGFGSSEFIVFRSKGEVVPDYLYYFLTCSQFRKDGAKRMSGAVGHKRVSKEFIEESILPFPKSLITQKQIVTKFDALSTSTKKLEKNYQRRIDDLEELKKSVLKRAFSGEL